MSVDDKKKPKIRDCKDQHVRKVLEIIRQKIDESSDQTSKVK